jgi:hypothetical protein
MNDQKSSALCGQEIGEGVPAFFFNEPIKDGVSGERSQHRSFARAMVLEMLRTK